MMSVCNAMARRLLLTITSEGKVATYILELLKADPDGFSFYLVTSDGYVSAGDTDQSFSIQSILKPFVYASPVTWPIKVGRRCCIGLGRTDRDACNSKWPSPQPGELQNHGVA